MSASAEPTIVTQYGPRPHGLFGTGALLVKTINSNGGDTFAYSHHDHLDAPIHATDKNGNVVWSACYNVFGQATITTPAASMDKPTISSVLRLPGQIEDEETGLHYNWHRYYEPGLGRYVTADPIGLVAGMNLYTYVGGNPLSKIDPSGLTFQSNWNFFWDWTLGVEHRNRNYGPNDVETQEVAKGAGAGVVRDLFYKKGCKNVTDVGYSSFHAFRDTIYLPAETPFQVGGFAKASATNNGNGTVTFDIPNTADAHSFFYHAVPDRTSPTGPMSIIVQDFKWTEPINSDSKCGCK